MNSIPEILKCAGNDQVLEYLVPLSCHSDIIDPLRLQFERYPDVQWFCPDLSGYRYFLWYVEETILAFAAGMHNISLRLPGRSHEEAIEDGAIKCEAAGSDWFSFPYDAKVLGKWVDISYEYAKNP